MQAEMLQEVSMPDWLIILIIAVCFVLTINAMRRRSS